MINIQNQLAQGSLLTLSISHENKCSEDLTQHSRESDHTNTNQKHALDIKVKIQSV